ncbi:Polyphenol oxidase [Bienertia sinuspersici]
MAVVGIGSDCGMMAEVGGRGECCGDVQEVVVVMGFELVGVADLVVAPRWLGRAYKVYLSKLKGNALKTRRKDLLFKQIECAQQTKGTECGYYVMRFMYEVVVAHNGCKGDLEKVSSL